MSRYALEWAKQRRTADAEEKAVLLVVADHAEGPGSICTLLEENLADEAGLSRKDLAEVIKRLEVGGHIKATVVPRVLEALESKQAASMLRHLQAWWGENVKFELLIGKWSPPARVPKPDSDGRRAHSVATAVYRLYDELGVLLYVGISNQPPTRFEQHRMKMPWWNRVVTREIEWYETRPLAEAEEYRAIVQDSPVYNVHHASKSGRADYSKRQEYTVLRTSPDAFNAALAQLRSDLRAGLYDVSPLPRESALASQYGVLTDSVYSLIREVRKEFALEIIRGRYWRAWSEW